MKTALHLLAAATLLVTPRLTAQQAVSVATGIAQSDGEVSPAVQQYISRGDSESAHLRFDAAIRAYRQATEAARHEGHLPSWTSWKLATTCYYAGNFAAGAAVLDQLATEAAQVGDLGTEAFAIYYAAWLDGKAGLKTETAARLTRLENLLRSRYLPVAIRDRLSSLLSASREVAARSTP